MKERIQRKASRRRTGTWILLPGILATSQAGIYTFNGSSVSPVGLGGGCTRSRRKITSAANRKYMDWNARQLAIFRGALQSNNDGGFEGKCFLGSAWVDPRFCFNCKHI
ncbi:hypothetical protein V5799_011819 [Amblyomma americanum]|uniref:Uncharacterized protein n=1 Tax=Amblyomma americanum TaxID=6943 RepID=A0AAQ4EFS7_AMBAM